MSLHLRTNILYSQYGPAVCVCLCACLCMCSFGFECLIGFTMHRWAKRRHLHDWRLQSTPGLDAVPSRSPSAPLILSKSHYNPTNPTASHHDCLLSGSSALHIRIWSWAGGSSPPPLPSLRKPIPPPPPVCLFLIVAGKCIRGLAAGAKEAGTGEVAGNSFKACTGKGVLLANGDPV